jgi:hypothetical protein
MRTVLFCAIMQRVVVIPYRWFGTTSRPLLQGSRITFEEELSEIWSKMYFGLLVNYPLFLSYFNETWIFSTKYSYINCHEYPWSGSCVVPCRQTDRHDEANNRHSKLPLRSRWELCSSGSITHRIVVIPSRRFGQPIGPIFKDQGVTTPRRFRAKKSAVLAKKSAVLKLAFHNYANASKKYKYGIYTTLVRRNTLRFLRPTFTIYRQHRGWCLLAVRWLHGLMHVFMDSYRNSRSISAIRPIWWIVV